jgi:hypothetical protein
MAIFSGNGVEADWDMLIALMATAGRRFDPDRNDGDWQIMAAGGDGQAAKSRPSQALFHSI